MECRPLDITIVSAKGHKKVKDVPQMLVYLEANVSTDPDAKQRTPAADDSGNSPAWNFPMQFVIDVASLQKDGPLLILKLRCQRPGGDLDIGETQVPIKELLEKAGRDKDPKKAEYPIKKPSGKEKGVLKFTFKFGEKLPGGFPFQAPPSMPYTVATTQIPIGYPPVGYPQAGLGGGYELLPQGGSKDMAPPLGSYPQPSFVGGYQLSPQGEPRDVIPRAGYPQPAVSYPQALGGYPQPIPSYPQVRYPQPTPGYPEPTPRYPAAYGYQQPVKAQPPPPPPPQPIGDIVGFRMGAAFVGGVVGGMVLSDIMSTGGPAYETGFDSFDGYV